MRFGRAFVGTLEDEAARADAEDRDVAVEAELEPEREIELLSGLEVFRWQERTRELGHARSVWHSVSELDVVHRCSRASRTLVSNSDDTAALAGARFGIA